jgi:FKBP-type peptidyl-prolyl cis-trans isomerase FkpA
MRLRKRAVAALLAAAACAACAMDSSLDAPASTAQYHAPPKNAFEDAFSRQPGVQPIQWGGWIQNLTEGGGPSPTPDSVVSVNYRGTLTDGTEFDSSYKRGQPATFPLTNVIPCWTNGVAMMKVGGKAKLVCPASSAYGDAGSPPSIPGGATLVFEIELLSIVR